MHRSPAHRSHRSRVITSGICSSIVVVLVLVAAIPSMAAAPTPVLAKANIDEYIVTASPGVLAWTQNSADRPHHYNSYARPEGEPKIRLNELGTQSFSAAVYGPTVLYEQVGGEDENGNPRVDLKLYDLETGDRTDPGAGVNTRYAEYEVGISADYFFFTRSRFGGKWVKLILYNRQTGTSRIVAQADPRHQYLASNQVNGDWAVWELCRFVGGQFSKCNVFRYHISTGSTFRLPNPGKQQFASAVASDGTVYLYQVGGSDYWRCGRNGVLLRYPLGGPATPIASMPEGVDVFTAFALDEEDGSVSLLFDRVDCETFYRDIYEIANADSA